MQSHGPFPYAYAVLTLPTCFDQLSDNGAEHAGAFH